jgi:circadian clock protein KaiB
VLAVARLVAVERSMGRAVDLEVIDVFQQGERARAAKLIGVPALIRDGPRMSCRLLGDLSDQQRIVRALRLSSLESCEREGSGG